MSDVEREILTLPAYRIPDGALAVWCDHCRCWHWHGGCVNTCTERRRAWSAKGHPVFQGEPCHCPPGVGDGHRVTHCHDPSSPYDNQGCSLQEVGDFNLALESSHPLMIEPHGMDRNGLVV
jgi:hypothetical protein